MNSRIDVWKTVTGTILIIASSALAAAAAVFVLYLFGNSVFAVIVFFALEILIPFSVFILMRKRRNAVEGDDVHMTTDQTGGE